MVWTKSGSWSFSIISLGIKGIFLGPTLPAFLSPNVLQYLVDTFDLRLISTPDDDLKSCLEQVYNILIKLKNIV